MAGSEWEVGRGDEQLRCCCVGVTVTSGFNGFIGATVVPLDRTVRRGVCGAAIIMSMVFSTAPSRPSISLLGSDTTGLASPEATALKLWRGAGDPPCALVTSETLAENGFAAGGGRARNGLPLFGIVVVRPNVFLPSVVELDAASSSPVVMSSSPSSRRLRFREKAMASASDMGLKGCGLPPMVWLRLPGRGLKENPPPTFASVVVSSSSCIEVGVRAVSGGVGVDAKPTSGVGGVGASSPNPGAATATGGIPPDAEEKKFVTLLLLAVFVTVMVAGLTPLAAPILMGGAEDEEEDPKSALTLNPEDKGFVTDPSADELSDVDPIPAMCSGGRVEKKLGGLFNVGADTEAIAEANGLVGAPALSAHFPPNENEIFGGE